MNKKWYEISHLQKSRAGDDLILCSTSKMKFNLHIKILNLILLKVKTYKNR